MQLPRQRPGLSQAEAQPEYIEENMTLNGLVDLRKFCEISTIGMQYVKNEQKLLDQSLMANLDELGFAFTGHFFWDNLQLLFN